MSSVGKVTPLEAGALTDVFSNPSWLARQGAVLGLDVQCTKTAVDLQNLRSSNADEVVAAALETLRSATASDCAFLARLTAGGERFGTVTIIPLVGGSGGGGGASVNNNRGGAAGGGGGAILIASSGTITISGSITSRGGAGNAGNAGGGGGSGGAIRLIANTISGAGNLNAAGGPAGGVHVPRVRHVVMPRLGCLVPGHVYAEDRDELLVHPLPERADGDRGSRDVVFEIHFGVRGALGRERHRNLLATHDTETGRPFIRRRDANSDTKGCRPGSPSH